MITTDFVQFTVPTTTDKLVEIDIPLNIVKHVGIGDSHIIKLCRENKIKLHKDESAGDHGRSSNIFAMGIVDEG
jgi:hypothetical protein